MTSGGDYNHGMAELVMRSMRFGQRFHRLKQVVGREPGAGDAAKVKPLLPLSFISLPSAATIKR
ncbi:MAG: hypothetical protein P8164_10030 [Gammaproteobacteria bacterium]|jgi:hypothetical protein